MLKLHFIGYYPVTRMFNTVIYFSRYQLQEKKKLQHYFHNFFWKFSLTLNISWWLVSWTINGLYVVCEANSSKFLTGGFAKDIVKKAAKLAV